MYYPDWVNNVIAWFETNGRNFYWRNHELNQFQWLALEILLRRSKAERVNGLSNYFFKKYKVPQDFINTSDEELSNDLKTIGYHHNKAIILKEVAQQIIENFDGSVPCTFEELFSLKHIGTYIASAFFCFYLGNTEKPCIDVNIIRVVSRVYGIDVKYDNRKDTIIYAIVKDISPREVFQKFMYSLLDLGGIVCLPLKPKCSACPISDKCYYNISRRENKEEKNGYTIS